MHVLFDTVRALCVYDDGSGGGPALFIGGAFTYYNFKHILKWDGQSLSDLGGGVNNTVMALATFDDGSGTGPAIYAGGYFSQAGGQAAQGIAKWDGQSWSSVGGGAGNVLALAAFDDDGTGSALFAGGRFSSAGGVAANNMARWDGQSWSALGDGVQNDSILIPVVALAVFDDGAGNGPLLHVGGTFTASPGGDSYLAQWGCRAPDTLGTPFCFGGGSQAPCLCSNLGAPGQGCANSTGQGAVLSAGGSTSIGAADLVLSAVHLPSNLVGVYFQGDSRVAGGKGTVLGDGLLCAGGTLVRLEYVQADATGHSSTTMNIASQGGVGGGDTRTYQLWYRDPFGSPCLQGFNLSNGLELVWEP